MLSFSFIYQEILLITPPYEKRNALYYPYNFIKVGRICHKLIERGQERERERERKRESDYSQYLWNWERRENVSISYFLYIYIGKFYSVKYFNGIFMNFSCHSFLFYIWCIKHLYYATSNSPCLWALCKKKKKKFYQF